MNHDTSRHFHDTQFASWYLVSLRFNMLEYAKYNLWFHILKNYNDNNNNNNNNNHNNNNNNNNIKTTMILFNVL